MKDVWINELRFKCFQCAHVVIRVLRAPMCSAPRPVQTCKEMRLNRNKCGKEARFFVAKE